MTDKKRFRLTKLTPVSSTSPLGPYVVATTVAMTAVVIGLAIGQGQWLFACGMLLIPCVLLYPVQVAFGIFALLIPFDAILVLGQGAKGRTLTSLAGAATGAILLGAGLAARRLKPLPSAGIWWVMFAAWCLVTSVWALNVDSSLSILPTIVSLLGLYLASSCFRYTDGELKVIILLSILGGCLAAIWTAHLFYQGSYFEKFETRASLMVGGRATNPDGLGMSLLLPISLAFGCFLACKRRLVKTVMLLAMAVTTLGLLVTMSRGAALALLAVLFVYLYRLRMGRRIIAPVILLAICLAVMPSAFFERFQEASESGGSGRIDIWKVGLKAFEHYGVLGAGLENFPYAYTNYMSEAPHNRGPYRDAHNIYLAVGVETGMVGVLLFAGAIGSQIRVAHRLKNRPGVYNLLIASEAACWGVLVFGVFGNVLWDKAFWLPWMLLSAAVSAASSLDMSPTSSANQAIQRRSARGLYNCPVPSNNQLHSRLNSHPTNR